jgi:hypothetical protein
VELNYDIHDKELLAIIEALNKWGTYCKSTPHMINILSDNKNLEYWQTKRDLNLRQARWSELLANYNFVITYRPGKLAGKPDILSRESGDSPWEGEMKHRQNKGHILLPADTFRTTTAKVLAETFEVNTAEIRTTTAEVPAKAFEVNTAEIRTTTAEVPAETFQINTAEIIRLWVDGELLKEIKDGTVRDEEMQDVITKLRNGEWKDSRVTLGLCQEQDGLLTYEGLLWVPNNDQLRLKLLYDHHDSLVAGHPGRAKILELISRNYYWPHQRQYMNRYIDHCDTCKRIKPVKHAPFGLLRPL